MTLRNTIGIQIISAADGMHKQIATPANTRVTGLAGRLTVPAWPT